VNVYFPIARRGAKKKDFPGRVGKNIPGLRKVRPKLFAVLESFQEFSNPGNDWLPDLTTLTNESKHVQFSVQVRLEEGGIILENLILPDQHSVLGMRMYRGFIVAAGSVVQLGAGAELRAKGGIVVRGPRKILGQAPYLDPPGADAAALRKLAFADVRFQLNNFSVFAYLNIAINGTADIVEKIAAEVQGSAPLTPRGKVGRSA
jgi:hypothetical protein